MSGDKELEKKVLMEIGLDHESLQDGVKSLRNWLDKQPHLPKHADDDFLKAFIVGSKSVERAKNKLDNFYKNITRIPYLYENRDPTKIPWEKVEKCLTMPGLTEEGYSILCVNPPYTREDLDAFSLVETIRATMMIVDQMMMSNPISSGQYIIIDAKHLSTELVLKANTSMSVSMHAFSIYQESMPIRMKGFVVFNASSAAEMFVNAILKVFLTQKHKERIFVHSEDHRILSKYVPLDFIPKDFGGLGSSLSEHLERIKKELERSKGWFLKAGSVGSDESKRPSAERNTDQVQGTFRKLQID